MEQGRRRSYWEAHGQARPRGRAFERSAKPSQPTSPVRNVRRRLIVGGLAGAGLVVWETFIAPNAEAHRRAAARAVALLVATVVAVVAPPDGPRKPPPPSVRPMPAAQSNVTTPAPAQPTLEPTPIPTAVPTPQPTPEPAPVAAPTPSPRVARAATQCPDSNNGHWAYQSIVSLWDLALHDAFVRGDGCLLARATEGADHSKPKWPEVHDWRFRGNGRRASDFNYFFDSTRSELVITDSATNERLAVVTVQYFDASHDPYNGAHYHVVAVALS